MPFRVLYRRRAIGTSEFESADLEMGVLLGRFYPTPEYQAVAHVFRLYAEALKKQPADESKLQAYYAARDGLALELRDPRGQAVAAILTIEDEQAMGFDDALYGIEAIVTDQAWFAREAERRRAASEPRREQHEP